ncbi:MAG: AAA family ATPase [Sphingopyxis sp.]|nr:AAA family ATPase [Sphingopyxis sp.]
MTPQIICIAGAESTGKSWLAHRLAAHFGIGHVTEYARAYCAEHGNALTPDQLAHIGLAQDAMIRDAVTTAVRDNQQLVVTDTDALVTSVWTMMLHPEATPDWYATDFVRPDLTLVTAVDLPWRDDGVRIQRQDADRRAFTVALIDALDRRGHRWASVDGVGEARFTNALRLVGLALQP